MHISVVGVPQMRMMQVVMLGAAAVCAYQGGVTELLFRSCPAMSDVGTVSLLRPWAALGVIKVLGELTATCTTRMIKHIRLLQTSMLIKGI